MSDFSKTVGDRELSDDRMTWFVKLKFRSYTLSCPDGESDCDYPTRMEKSQEMSGVFLSDNLILTDLLTISQDEMIVEISTNSGSFTRSVSQVKILNGSNNEHSYYSTSDNSVEYSLVKLVSPIEGISYFPCVPTYKVRIHQNDRVIIPKFVNNRKMITVEAVDDTNQCLIKRFDDFCIRTPYNLGNWVFVEKDKMILLVGMIFSKQDLHHSSLTNYKANTFFTISYDQDTINAFFE